MATGASTADVAILMIDARKGVLTQTKRHSTIIHLLGVQHVVLAINKMDLVGYRHDIYDHIVADYRQFADQLGLTNITAIPMSAFKGGNITSKSSHMPWYTGSTLMNYLETVTLSPPDTASFSMPIQWVNRPHLDFRGFSGQISSGVIHKGDEVTILPSGITSHIQSIVTFDGDLSSACSGQSVTLTLTDDVDISRGDIMVTSNSSVSVAHKFVTTILWMSETPLVAGKLYGLKIRAKLVSATLSSPRYQLDIHTRQHLEADQLKLNEIGECELTVDQDIAFEPYTDNMHLGSAIIIDRITNNTVGMCLIQHAVDTQTWVSRYIEQRNKYWVRGNILASDRHKRYGHKPLLVLLTGDAMQSTYSTYATQLEQALFNQSIIVYRHGFQYMKTVDHDALDLRQDMLQQLMELSYAFLVSGNVFITTIQALTNTEYQHITQLSAPFDVHVVGIEYNTPYTNTHIHCIDAIDTTLVPALLKRIQL